MKPKRALPLALIAAPLLMAAYGASAAEDGATLATPVKQSGASELTPLDQIIINARRERLSKVRAEIQRSEIAFYDAFNAVNKDPQYKTPCDVLTRKGGLRILVCTPQFVLDSTEEHIGGVGGGLLYTGGGIWAAEVGGRMDPGGNAAAAIADKMPAYKKHLHDLVDTHPALRRALFEYVALVKHYEALRKAKLKGKWIVWD